MILQCRWVDEAQFDFIAHCTITQRDDGKIVRHPSLFFQSDSVKNSDGGGQVNIAMEGRVARVSVQRLTS